MRFQTTTLSLLALMTFSRLLFSQEARVDSVLGSTITYVIKQSPDSTWERLSIIAKTYPFHYKTYFGHKHGSELGTIQINPIEKEIERRTEIYLKVFIVDTVSSKVLIYKNVYNSKTEWAWSLHNLLGLFEFVTFAVPEPKETPFAEDQLREISKIISFISK